MSEPQTAQDTDALLSICPECGFVAAEEVEDFDDVMGSADDPGASHYHKTDHGCGTFEPSEDSPLYEHWEAYNEGADLSDVPPVEELWEMATGREIEA